MRRVCCRNDERYWPQYAVNQLQQQQQQFIDSPTYAAVSQHRRPISPLHPLRLRARAVTRRKADYGCVARVTSTSRKDQASKCNDVNHTNKLGYIQILCDRYSTSTPLMLFFYLSFLAMFYVGATIRSKTRNNYCHFKQEKTGHPVVLYFSVFYFSFLSRLCFL